MLWIALGTWLDDSVKAIAVSDSDLVILTQLPSRVYLHFLKKFENSFRDSNKSK